MQDVLPHVFLQMTNLGFGLPLFSEATIDPKGLLKLEEAHRSVAFGRPVLVSEHFLHVNKGIVNL